AGHRLLLYYSSLEELSTCFVAAVTIASPDVPLPASIEAAATELRSQIEPRLSGEQRAELEEAVRAFEAGKRRAKLASWVGAVERCATRAGFLLAEDLDAAAGLVRGDPRGVVDAEAKVRDLYAFAVSDAYHTLREELGVAIQP
ncbi:MAG TPA: hypothetical protein VHB21_23500, partial [Minicystis sp.]|nr:hypothetical protein [Minicystis sp.]